jgi:hypothetical protein
VRKIVPAAASTALLWAACCAALVWRSGFPDPEVHDEFSYLLGADTFAHGRLANPPHPLGRFFESPNILVSPKYVPKYPPGQALFLALGERMFGAPYYGVLLSGATMMFLLTMTLVAWTSPGPGIAVSVVAGLLFLPPMYWVYSYWGGCVAAAGGAAVLLAFALYRRDSPVAAGVTFGLGALTLVVTRPFEGGALTAAAIAICGFALVRERGRRTALAGMRTFLFSAAPVIVAGLLWAGWYNAAITGNPFRLAYLLHDSHYNSAPLFWFLPLRPEPQYASARIAAQYGRNGVEFRVYRTMISGGYYRRVSATAKSVRPIFGWALALLLLVPLAWRDWRIRTLAAILGVCLLALSLETSHFPHYAAPFTAAIALLPACAAEKSWRLRIGSVPWGAIFTCLVFAGACISPIKSAVTTARNGVNKDGTFGSSRAELIRRLSEMDGDHLVIVRYPYPAWRVRDEWVYNGADIDSQKTVFAHDLGMKENEEILGYYPSRRKWLLTFSGDLLQLSPY